MQPIAQPFEAPAWRAAWVERIPEDSQLSDPQANKQTAIEFYELMFNEGRPREAQERYAGAEYRQHNPGVGDGKEAFIDYFDRMAVNTPASESR